MIDRRLGSLVLAQCLVAALAASCGGTTESKPSAAAGSGAGGTAGAGTEAHGGHSGSTPAAGASTGGRSSNAGAGTGAGAASSEAGSAADSGDSGSSGEGGSDNAGGEAGAGGEGGEGGATDQDPPIDVGVGCLQPASAPKLTPAAAGLPATGLTLWLRGDRGVYATDQHRVCAWADQSGNKFLFLAGSGSRPLWGASNLGARAGIEFDASNSLLSINGVLGIHPTSGRTFVAVIQSIDTGGRFAAVQQGQSGTPGTYLGIDTNTYNTAGSHEGVYICNNSYDAATATSTSARVHVYTIETMVAGQPVIGNIDYRVNGVTQTLTRNDGGLGNGNIEDFSGANFSLVGGGAHAIIAEALIYNHALSIAERSQVETALKARYAVQ